MFSNHSRIDDVLERSDCMEIIRDYFDDLKLDFKSFCLLIFGSGLLAFGLYHVHSFSGITEGGVLGFTLLLYQWFDISPAISGFVLNLLCYGFGVKLLGKRFTVCSVIAAIAYSLFYSFFEQFPLLWPQLVDMPLVASIVGGLFVGVSVGICVRVGGAPGGDDALAMTLAYVYKTEIQNIYLITDLIVLTLSLSYIPFGRIIYSFITVIISGQIVGIIAKK